MKKYIFPIAALLLVISSAFVIPAVTEWKIDAKYSVKFSSSEMKGVLKGLKGTIKFDENDLDASLFDVTFDVNTIDLGSSDQNNHAKEKGWLDAATYPTIHFTSASFSKTNKGFEVKGNLTIKGVTKEISYPFTFSKKTKAGTFKGSFTIAPKDYNISEEGIGEEIKIDFNIPVKL